VAILLPTSLSLTRLPQRLTANPETVGSNKSTHRKQTKCRKHAQKAPVLGSSCHKQERMPGGYQRDSQGSEPRGSHRIKEPNSPTYSGTIAFVPTFGSFTLLEPVSH